MVKLVVIYTTHVRMFGLISHQLVHHFATGLRRRSWGGNGVVQPIGTYLSCGLGAGQFGHNLLTRFMLGGGKAYRVVQLVRSEEHTSERQSLMSISYDVF